MRFPEIVDGVKVRKLGDGSFMLPRCKPLVARQLDKDFIRVPGEKRWFERPTYSVSYDTMLEIFRGNDCYIVGKGPSLNSLRASDFVNDCPIIAINEAIRKVEALDIPNPIFMMQHDAKLRDTCMPNKGEIILSHHAKETGCYADRTKYVYFPAEYGCTAGSLTVICAIKMLQKLGVTGITFVAFDACMGGSLDYALCVGYKSSRNNDPRRFLKHRDLIDRVLTVNAEWFKPPLPVVEEPCIPEPLPHNQPEHREHEDEESQEPYTDRTDLSSDTESADSE